MLLQSEALFTQPQGRVVKEREKKKVERILPLAPSAPLAAPAAPPPLRAPPPSAQIFTGFLLSVAAAA